MREGSGWVKTLRRTTVLAGALVASALLVGLLILGALCSVSEFTSEGPDGRPAQTRISFIDGGLFLGGTITAAGLPVFAAKLAVAAVTADGPVVVTLNSAGGNLEAALRMAAAIRLAGRIAEIGTLVPEDASCQSACTVVFAAGQDRMAGPSSVFMFHGIRWTGQKADADLETAARLEFDLERRYLDALTAADSALVEALKLRGVFDTVTPTFLTAQELRALGDRFISWRAPFPRRSAPPRPHADRR
jgi:ATP-dependent protease ClpP protease subunit